MRGTDRASDSEGSDIGSQQETRAPPHESLVVSLSSPETTSEQDEGAGSQVAGSSLTENEIHRSAEEFEKSLRLRQERMSESNSSGDQLTIRALEENAAGHSSFEVNEQRCQQVEVSQVTTGTDSDMSLLDTRVKQLLQSVSDQTDDQVITEEPNAKRSQTPLRSKGQKSVSEAVDGEKESPQEISGKLSSLSMIPPLLALSVVASV